MADEAHDRRVAALQRALAAKDAAIATAHAALRALSVVDGSTTQQSESKGGGSAPVVPVNKGAAEVRHDAFAEN